MQEPVNDIPFSVRQVEALVAFAGPGRSTNGQRQALFRLERELNEGRGVSQNDIRLLGSTPGTLTPEGERLAALAGPVVATLRTFRGALADLRGADAAVGIGAYPSHASIVALAAAELATANIPVRLLDVSDAARDEGGQTLIDRLTGGDLDVVITTEREPFAGIMSRKLYDWHLVAAVVDDHPLAGTGTVELSDLAGVRLLVSPQRHTSRSMLATAGVELNIVFESGSTDALLDLALIQRWGAALVPGDTIPVRHAAPELARQWPIVTRRGTPLRATVCALWRSSSGSSSAVAKAVDGIAGQLTSALMGPFVNILNDDGLDNSGAAGGSGQDHAGPR